MQECNESASTGRQTRAVQATTNRSLSSSLSSAYSCEVVPVLDVFVSVSISFSSVDVSEER